MQSSLTLYSIGHGRKPIEQLVAELNAFNIAYLADVRSKPYSRFNPQYNRKALEQSLANEGITYVFMGDELGGRPEDESCYTAGKINYDLLKEKEFFKSGINRLLTANEKGIKLAVMCSESKPQDCHRSRLIGKELLELGIPLKHIVKEGLVLGQNELEEKKLF